MPKPSETYSLMVRIKFFLQAIVALPFVDRRRFPGTHRHDSTVQLLAFLAFFVVYPARVIEGWE